MYQASLQFGSLLPRLIEKVIKANCMKLVLSLSKLPSPLKRLFLFD